MYNYTSSTAQGGGGSFKNRKPIGEVGCCESGMVERSHWWIQRWLISLTLSLSFSLFLSLFLSFSLIIYLPTYRSIYLSIDLSIYLSISISLCLFVRLSVYLVYLAIYLSLYLSISLSLSLSVCLSVYLFIYLSIYLQAWKRIYSARLPQFELDNIKNTTIQRDFLNVWTWQRQKRNNSVRHPQFSKLTTSKTKQFCETSFKNGKLIAKLTASCQ